MKSSNITYLSQLPEDIILMAQLNHAVRLTRAETHTVLAIMELSKRLPDHKISDLGDALDPYMYTYISKLQKGEICPDTKYYVVTDVQDESNSELRTLESAREWLIDFWNNNPDEDMTDEEHESYISDISTANEDELDEFLSGIDYYMEVF